MIQFQVGDEVPMTGLSMDTDSAADVAFITNNNTSPSAPETPAGSRLAADAFGTSLDTTTGQVASQHRAFQAGSEQATRTPNASGQVPLDQDTTAGQLASQHRAGVVAAASALTTMLTLSAETSSSWQIPVHIQKSHEVSESAWLEMHPMDGMSILMMAKSPKLMQQIS